MNPTVQAENKISFIPETRKVAAIRTRRSIAD